jgi:stearoyl-CoA desaturase (delta-9 desaturase)
MTIVGIAWYIINDGTVLKAFYIYLGFWIVSKIAKVGYHRWLSHNHISPGPIGRFIFLWAMVSSALVKPLHYVIGHRIHHKYPDTDKDPHPPTLGFFNNLIGNFNTVNEITVPVRDLYRKKDVMFVNNNYYRLYALNLIVLLLIDVDIFLLSFSLLNLRFMFNVAVFNYLTHGGKNNVGALNLPLWGFYFIGTPGEHFHKNHHDNPGRANLGRTSRWNFDLTYEILKKVTKVNE